MSDIDWSNIQDEMGGNYKKYAPDGKYKTRCTGMELKEVGQNGSIVQKFEFEEGDDYVYPTADHWLSFKNNNWRIWHNKCLMVALGASEENAKKAVEMCESKEKKEDKIKAYEQTYAKLLSKRPQVEIEVYTDGKYSRSEFTDSSVAMPHDTAKQDDNTPTEDDTPAESSDEEIWADMPF